MACARSRTPSGLVELGHELRFDRQSCERGHDNLSTPHQLMRLDLGGLSGAGRSLGAAQGEPLVVANVIHIHRARGESQELVGLVE